jgi:ParB-like chromosome segregation protein Spo0J
METTETTATTEKQITRLRDFKIGARDMFTIDPSVIAVEDSFNPRRYDLPENHAHLDELKRSIAQIGIQVPLLVRFDAEKKVPICVDGECRLRAVLELIAEGHDIKGVPVIQVPGNNQADRLLTAITANTGKPLSKWELGGAFQRFSNWGWTVEQIALKTGYNERFVRESIELADAPDEVKQLLSAQAITPSLALAELRQNGTAAVKTLQAKATEAKAKGSKGPAKRGKKSKSHPVPSGKAQAAPVAPTTTLSKALLDLLKDVTANDLKNEDVEYVSVVRTKLLKLASFVA